MSKRSELTESIKKEVAGAQYYRCANTPNSKLDKLEDYDCPLWESVKKNGSFDRSGYAIDHIIEYSLTQNNDITNLQALCPACHAVKTKKFMQVKQKKNNKKVIKKKSVKKISSCAKDQKVDNMSSSMKYLKYLVENDYRTPKPNSTISIKLSLEDGWIRADVLGQKYLDWIDVNSDNMVSNRGSTAGFTTQLKKINILPTSHRFKLDYIESGSLHTLENILKNPRGGKKGPPFRCFKIDEATLLVKFRKYLQDPLFKFDYHVDIIKPKYNIANKEQQEKEEDDDEDNSAPITKKNAKCIIFKSSNRIVKTSPSHKK